MTQPIVVRLTDLQQEIVRFSPDVPAGRRAEILVKTPSLRVVLVTMRAGTESQEHAVDGPITIQALTGAFVVSGEDEELQVPAGTLLALTGGVTHHVRCVEDGAFLLTISWLERVETS
jgi:quercetin dioxygenase-like cupin family protein